MRKSQQSRRRLGAVAVVAGTALLASGCGSGTPGQPAGQDDEVGPVVETVQFWYRTFTEPENNWYQDIVKQFNESQDAVKVVVTEVPGDAWDQKVKAAQAAGKAPDIYTTPGSIVEAVNAGEYHALDGIVSDEALAEIVDSARPISVVGDTHYAYPILLEPQVVLYWNKDMLAAADLDPEDGPKTWPDLLEACAAIKPTLSSGQYCISTAQDAGDFGWTTWGQQYNAAGHLALTDDWTEPNIDNQGYRALMANYKTLWDEDYLPKQALAHYNVAKDFGEGSVAFKVSGSWMMSEMGADYPDMIDKTGVGPFVTMPGAEGVTTSTIGNYKWVIDAKSAKAEAAGAFLEWALAGDPERLAPFFVDTQFSKVPVRQSVQELVNAKAEEEGVSWSTVLFDAIAPGAISEPAYSWDVSFAVGTAIETVMKGAASADEAIKTAEDTIRTVIQRDDLPSKVSN